MSKDKETIPCPSLFEIIKKLYSGCGISTRGLKDMHTAAYDRYKTYMDKLETILKEENPPVSVMNVMKAIDKLKKKHISLGTDIGVVIMLLYRSIVNNNHEDMDNIKRASDVFAVPGHIVYPLWLIDVIGGGTYDINPRYDIIEHDIIKVTCDRLGYDSVVAGYCTRFNVSGKSVVMVKMLPTRTYPVGLFIDAGDIERWRDYVISNYSSKENGMSVYVKNEQGINKSILIVPKGYMTKHNSELKANDKDIRKVKRESRLCSIINMNATKMQTEAMKMYKSNGLEKTVVNYPMLNTKRGIKKAIDNIINILLNITNNNIDHVVYILDNHLYHWIFGGIFKYISFNELQEDGGRIVYFDGSRLISCHQNAYNTALYLYDTNVPFKGTFIDWLVSAYMYMLVKIYKSSDDVSIETLKMVKDMTMNELTELIEGNNPITENTILINKAL